MLVANAGVADGDMPLHTSGAGIGYTFESVDTLIGFVQNPIPK